MEERDICQVTAKIVEAIPKEETETHARLADFATGLSYKAPEQRQQCWAALSEIVNAAVDVRPWQVEVVNLLTGRKG